MIDHDLAFLLEVLKVDGQTEDELDEKLKMEAKQLGVDIETEVAMDTYCSDYSRRSESIDSRASQSTGLASTFSDCSKDQTICDGHQRRSRASLSFKDYDSFVSRGVPNGRHSISFSPLSTPSHSKFSLPLSQPASPDVSPRRHFPRIRGLSLLRLHRSYSLTSLADGCPHCPRDLQSQKRAVHRLPCGHRLCTQALRNTVKAAIDSRRGAVPSCCRQPIPGKLVEDVMTLEEQAALLDRLEQWDEAISPTPSMNSSIHHQRLVRRAERDSQILEDSTSAVPISPRTQNQLKEVTERKDYRLLQVGQADQRDRYLAWAIQRRADLMEKHDKFRHNMKSMHEAVAEEMQEHHASATSDAEDKQVKAESDLRETLEKERCDNATALKHLEAYCAGTYSNGESHERIITDQARLELDKTRWHRDSMGVRHESAINVLRGEQNRRLRLRALRQDRELQDLRRQQRKEELELERSCNGELAKLNDSLDEKRRKLCWRHELQMAIFAKRIEAEIADWDGDSLKSSLGCLSVASSTISKPHLPRHDITTTQTDVVLHEPQSKYDRHSTGIVHVQEFKIGGM